MQHTYAIIGAGNGGQAMAAHLTLLGYRVRLYDVDQARIKHLRQARTITVTGQISGTATISEITSDLSDAVTGCAVIFVVTTTDRHADLVKSLIPLISENQLVVLCPGHTGGAMIVRNLFLAGRKNIAVVEMQDLIYTCRTDDAGHVTIMAIKKKIELAACRKSDIDAAMAAIGDIYPQLQPSDSILHTWFNNMGAILHPAPVLLNAGRIECGESFLYYREGITPAVANVLEQLDAERIAVARAYGIEPVSLAQWMKTAYDLEHDSLYELFQANPAYAAVKAITTLENRFLTEDVSSGLVPLAEFGRLAGVETPAMDSVITLAGMLLHRDFRKSGRNLENMGLKGKSVSEIKKIYT